MSASSLSLPIFLRINFLISYLIVTDSQNTFDWHTQRALLNDKKAGAGCTSRAFKHPGRDVTAPDVWPSILTDYTYDSELDNADGVPLASRRSSMFPEGNLCCHFYQFNTFLLKKFLQQNKQTKNITDPILLNDTECLINGVIMVVLLCVANGLMNGWLKGNNAVLPFLLCRASHRQGLCQADHWQASRHPVRSKGHVRCWEHGAAGHFHLWCGCHLLFFS